MNVPLALMMLSTLFDTAPHVANCAVPDTAPQKPSPEDLRITMRALEKAQEKRARKAANALRQKVSQ